MKQTIDIIRKLQTRWVKVLRRKFEENTGQMRPECIKMVHLRLLGGCTSYYNYFMLLCVATQ
jgi:hypothetical protein